MEKENTKGVVQQSEALAGQNKNTEGQRALCECYESIQDLLPETPASVWRAWVELGRKTCVDGSIIKRRRPWKH